MSVPSLFRRGSTLAPFRITDTRQPEFELYEEDDEFVLAVELPGFDADEITVTVDDDVLDVAAEHEDDTRNRRRTYHRRFRLPRAVDEAEGTARYENGVLEVRLPVVGDAPDSGRSIPVES